MNDSLEDDAWKDSFDKLLEPVPLLRQLNLLKKDVRASFNCDSSVENSVHGQLDASESLLDIVQSNLLETGKRRHVDPISTPIPNRLTVNPFRCPISPIGEWKGTAIEKENVIKVPVIKYFEPTAINIFDISDNVSEKLVNNDQKNEKPKQQKKRVCFKTTTESTAIEFANIESGQNNEVSVFDGLEPSTTKEFRISGKRSKDFLNINPQNKKQSLQKKKICFNTSTDFNTNARRTRTRSGLSAIKENNDNNKRTQTSSACVANINKTDLFATTTLILQPGKWRKSLSNWRHTQQIEFTNQQNHQANNTQTLLSNSIEFLDKHTFIGKRKSIFIKSERISEENLPPLENETLNFEKQVLKRCGQRRVISFERAYPQAKMKNCKKIGEGAYGEVFMNKHSNEVDTVLKIIPVEGLLEVNGEVQKTFEQILPEIVISKELSGLNEIDKKSSSTSCFIPLKKVSLVKGKYPAHLIELWEKYDEEKASENDHPEVFDASQLFIVLELQFGGIDLATFQYLSAEQSYYSLLQIILTLAVGEEAFQFEHRDLHWGNVLVTSTEDENVTFKLDNKIINIATKGTKISIIDYTLSRLTFNECCLYNDLSNDEELFAASGDYQYDIYRMMRDEVKNNWSAFTPKTNVFWISYIISKMINGVHYKSRSTKLHKAYLEKLKKLQKTILNMESAVESAKYVRQDTN